MGGGISYGTITGKSTSLFGSEPIYIIAIDGLQNEYAVTADALTLTRSKKNIEPTEQPKNE